MTAAQHNTEAVRMLSLLNGRRTFLCTDGDQEARMKKLSFQAICKSAALFLLDTDNKIFIRGMFCFKNIQTGEYHEKIFPNPLS